MKTLAKWSLEEYHRMISAGILDRRRVELIEGEIFEMSPQGPLHSSSCDKIAEYLRGLFKGIAKIRETHPVTLTKSEPEPDLAVVRLKENNYSDRHPHPEDIYWLIEIGDRSLNFDLEQKKMVYASAGIKEYWVIDPRAKKTIVFSQPKANEYLTKKEYVEGSIASLSFPQQPIDLDKIFN